MGELLHFHALDMFRCFGVYTRLISTSSLLLLHFWMIFNILIVWCSCYWILKTIFVLVFWIYCKNHRNLDLPYYISNICCHYYQRQIVAFFDVSKPIWYLASSDWKISLIISSVSLLIMISILFHFECIDCLSSLSFDDINFHF